MEDAHHNLNALATFMESKYCDNIVIMSPVPRGHLPPINSRRPQSWINADYRKLTQKLLSSSDFHILDVRPTFTLNGGDGRGGARYAIERGLYAADQIHLGRDGSWILRRILGRLMDHRSLLTRPRRPYVPADLKRRRIYAGRHFAYFF